MPINYKVKQLYDALKEDGADVGSEQEFNDWFFKPGDEGYKNRRSVYDAFKEDGAVKSKDYGEFSKRLGLHAVEAQKQSPALTQDVRRPQAPLPRLRLLCMQQHRSLQSLNLCNVSKRRSSR